MDEAVRIVVSSGNSARLRAKAANGRIVASVTWQRTATNEDRAQFHRTLTSALIHLGIRPSFHTMEGVPPEQQEQLTEQFLRGGSFGSEQVQ